VGTAQGGGEHASERTRTCVSERRSRQRRDVPAWQATVAFVI
jgi:hypothetical protein